MRLQAINIGLPRTVDIGAGPESTAIFKTSVDGPVTLSTDGLDGDEVGDAKHHGGVDQAVYVYFESDYRHWEALLERSLEPGTFADNLTIADGVQGVSSHDLWVGDRLEVGPVVLEMTAPRIPCGTFARRMGLPASFIDRFRDELRPGVYARVLKPGPVTVGDPVQLTEGSRTLAIVELVELFGTRPDRETIERVLAAPVAGRVREDFERKRDRA